MRSPVRCRYPPNSVYLYLPDRDALVTAAMEHFHEDMLHAADEAEDA